jgi:oxalate---CoA ligase
LWYSGVFRDVWLPFRNQNALGGPIPQELFNEATALDTLYKHQESWKEWSLRASDGDLAMLLQMTSEGLVCYRLIEAEESIDGVKLQVDFKLDISGAKAARAEIDWNSKKAGMCRTYTWRTS